MLSTLCTLFDRSALALVTVIPLAAAFFITPSF